MEQVYLIAREAPAAHARVEALVREHQVKLARYVRRMVGDADVALDIVQDVFFAAYRTLQADAARPLTAGWLYKTATNTSISFLRRKKILRFMPLERDPDVRSLRIDERSAASLDLQAAMQRLPADQAAAIMLTSYAGYSSAEAAAILGTTADAVRQRVCRAMRTLRAVMAESDVKSNLHDRIEAIAGAIALGEAADEERRHYREHIAACATCLRALGGEREIERVASTVAFARDEEIWEPNLGDVVGARARGRARALRWSAGAAGLAIAASFGIHLVFAAAVPRMNPALGAPVVINAGPTRIVLEQNTAAQKPAPPAPATQRRMIVTHNVVQIGRAPDVAPIGESTLSARVESKPRALVAITVHPDPTAAPPAARDNVPPWRRNSASWHTVARTTTTSVTETAPQSLMHSAESLQLAAPYTTREVAPVGGDAAINPQPPMIAYDEGAEGTTVFEVLVDERGMPTKCVITKPAGYPILDDAVCKAAMKARYTPKLVDGRPAAGVYHDAFTFHMSDQASSNINGVRSPIPDQMLPQRPRTPGSDPGGNPGG